MQLRSTRRARQEATRILIADDDLITRRLLQKTLERAGYEVEAVQNGHMALEALSSQIGPRLALLDWLMSGLSGPEVCREIRRHSEYPYIYIILLTAKAAKVDVVKGLEAGADDYITKPCDAEELKARLRSGERILKLEDKLTYDALHDPLTQLPNRSFFLDRLTLCVSWGMLHPEYKFAVLSIDMDRFKVVNDSLGISAGDWLLVQIAGRLLSSIRRDDALLRSAEAGGLAGQSEEVGILARLGGDKFTILLDNIRNASEGIRVAERIQQSIQEPFDVDGQPVFTTASVGIAFSGTGYSAAEDMLGDANTAMARAKTLGKARGACRKAQLSPLSFFSRRRSARSSGRYPNYGPSFRYQQERLLCGYHQSVCQGRSRHADHLKGQSILQNSGKGCLFKDGYGHGPVVHHRRTRAAQGTRFLAERVERRESI
jgi:two-component system cell cycle response regulator